MIVSPARNFVLSVAAGFVFNLSFMASIIIIYEEVKCCLNGNFVTLVHSCQFIRLLSINGTSHSPTISTYGHCDSHHFLTSSGFARQRLPCLAQRISWTPTTSFNLLGVSTCDSLQSHEIHWKDWDQIRLRVIQQRVLSGITGGCKCYGVLYPSPNFFISMVPQASLLQSETLNHAPCNNNLCCILCIRFWKPLW